MSFVKFRGSNIIIGIIVAAIVIFGSAFYLFQNKNEIVDECVNGYKKFSKENFGFFEQKQISFELEYPCDWNVVSVPENNHLTITAPDNSGSFAWPILDVDMADFTTDGGTFMSLVNGVEYMGHRYSGPTKTIDFIYLPVTDGTILNGMNVIYSDSTSKEAVQRIISSIKF